MKSIFTICFLLMSVSSVFAQITIELRPGYNDELCPGFESENEGIMDIRNVPPITPSPNSSVEYYWIVQHEEGTWSWQTDSPARGFLIPFEGEYTLRCQVLYISLGNSYPYAAFWSSPMLIEAGEGCD
jgi:hypothetical protein